MAAARPPQIRSLGPIAQQSAQGQARPSAPQGIFARTAKIAGKTAKNLRRSNAPTRPTIGPSQVNAAGRTIPGITQSGLRRMQGLFPNADLSQFTDRLRTGGQAEGDVVNQAVQAGLQAQQGGGGQPQPANQPTQQAPRQPGPGQAQKPAKPQTQDDVALEIIKTLSKRLNA